MTTSISRESTNKVIIKKNILCHKNKYTKSVLYWMLIDIGILETLQSVWKNKPCDVNRSITFKGFPFPRLLSSLLLWRHTANFFGHFLESRESSHTIPAVYLKYIQRNSQFPSNRFFLQAYWIDVRTFQMIE